MPHVLCDYMALFQNMEGSVHRNRNGRKCVRSNTIQVPFACWSTNTPTSTIIFQYQHNVQWCHNDVRSILLVQNVPPPWSKEAIWRIYWLQRYLTHNRILAFLRILITQIHCLCIYLYSIPIIANFVIDDPRWQHTDPRIYSFHGLIQIMNNIFINPCFEYSSCSW